MSNKMDKKTIDKTADLIKRYLDVNQNSNYEWLLNDRACWQGNIQCEEDEVQYKKVLKDISRMETHYKSLNVFFDQIVKQARETAK